MGCEIVGVESESCSYSCKHDSDSTCYGTKYSYTAYAREKCGEDPLYSSDFDGADCPGSYFAPQQTKKCYVLGCVDQEFSWSHSSEQIASGVGVLIMCIVVMCCPCGYMAYSWLRSS